MNSRDYKTLYVYSPCSAASCWWYFFLIVTSTAALTIILHFICLGCKDPYECLWLVTLASTFREVLASLDLLLVPLLCSILCNFSQNSVLF